MTLKNFGLRPKPKAAMGQIVPVQNIIQRAFNDYMALGPGRTAMALYRDYTERVKDDPSVFVPSTDLRQIEQWEVQYGWKGAAFSYDNETMERYRRIRKDLLTKSCKRYANIADTILSKAESALEKLEPDQLDPERLLRYLTDGVKLLQQVQDQQLKLQDPSGDSGSDDVFDMFRKMHAMPKSVSMMKVEFDGSGS